jgi:hypothetical protein
MVLQLLPQLGSRDRQGEEGQMTVIPKWRQEHYQTEAMDEMPYLRVELLRYCDETGEGTLALSQRFLDEPNLFKADVLKDWIAELTYEYNQILREGL